MLRSGSKHDGGSNLIQYLYIAVIITYAVLPAGLRPVASICEVFPSSPVCTHSRGDKAIQVIFTASSISVRFIFGLVGLRVLKAARGVRSGVVLWLRSTYV